MAKTQLRSLKNLTLMSNHCVEVKCKQCGYKYCFRCEMGVCPLCGCKYY